MLTVENKVKFIKVVPIHRVTVPTYLFLSYYYRRIDNSSVAEPPLFWAAPAPAPGRQGPGADSGSGSRQKKAAPGGSGSIH